MPSSLSLHFDGDIVSEHLISARTLGKALTHTQHAIDRAHLELKYGNLWKHARMSGEDYEAADFIALYPEEGGFVQKLLSEGGQAIVDRVAAALRPAMERAMHEGEENLQTMQQQVITTKEQVRLGLNNPISYAKLVDQPEERAIRSYGDRAINREIDMVLSIIRSKSAGESTLEITTQGSETENYLFNRHNSKRFHSIISTRQIGDPVIYNSRVRQLDRDLLNGKIVNLENDRTVNIKFATESDFVKVHPFLGNNELMTFIGAPIVEYGAFDPNAGDIYFVDLAS